MAQPMNYIITDIRHRALKNLHESLATGYSESHYLTSRILYTKTRGNFNQELNTCIGAIRPRISYETHSLDAIILNKKDPIEIADNLQKSGGYVVENLKLKASIYEEFCNALDSIDSSCTDNGQKSSRSFISNWSVIRKLRLPQILISSRTLKAVADAYLGCNSFVSLAVAWKTRPADRTSELLNQDALQFHFDCDHNRFLKVFVYLDDVDEKTGPHVAIPFTGGSYGFETLHPTICEDRRISNLEIVNHGLNPIYYCGEKGTLILGDTHNFHRGTPVYPGRSRYIFQLQFSDSIFGAKLTHAACDIIEMNYLHLETR